MLSHPYWASLVRARKTTWALCLVVFVATPFLVVLGVTALVALFLRGPIVLDFLLNNFALIALPLMAIWIASTVLWLRKCEQCGRRPFTVDGASLFAARFYGITASTHFDKLRITPIEKPLLDNPRTHAIIQTLRHGRTRCIWCGHVLGERPAYVIVARDERF